ncbi:ribbon-helix-helix domain-containing protein, partial [Azospirillum sp. B4]|uniref:ribbon-helix-helix domain-containing protein n=1 Tax=Azospirillum sp. B4 TaxID=95605 RepID=UPI0011DE1128
MTMGDAMDGPPEKFQVSVRVPSDLVTSLDKVAAALDRDRSWVILRALRQYLAQEGGHILSEAEGSPS